MDIVFPGTVLESLRKHLDRHGDVVILSHINPDGDSIGASLALKLALDQQNIPVHVIVPNAIPSFLKWLPGCGEAIIAKDDPGKANEVVQSADMIFFIDFNELHRLDILEDAVRKNSAAFRVLIDHHPDPDIEAGLVLSDTGVSSTAELMYMFIRTLFPGPEPTQEIAAALYTGIMTDTGGFSHNIRQPETLRIASELLKTGINHDDIHGFVYDNFKENRMKLLGFALHERMRIMADCHTGYIALSRDDLAVFNHEPGDTEGFVNLPLSVEGIRCSVLFLEKKDHIKISFRSKGSFAVNEFSKRYYNGGGHVNAAGGESHLTLKETVNEFERKIREHADEI